MQRNCLHLFLCFVSCLALKGNDTPNFSPDYKNCTSEVPVKIVRGESLSLVGYVDITEHCYFVFHFTEDSQEKNSFKCCYGSKKDCDTSPDYTSTNESRCLQKNQYYVTDEELTESVKCTLHIASPSDINFGKYEIFTNAHQQTKHCHVLAVMNTKDLMVVVGILVLVIILVLVLMVYVAIVAK